MNHRKPISLPITTDKLEGIMHYQQQHPNHLPRTKLLRLRPYANAPIRDPVSASTPLRAVRNLRSGAPSFWGTALNAYRVAATATGTLPQRTAIARPAHQHRSSFHKILDRLEELDNFNDLVLQDGVDWEDRRLLVRFGMW
jgi:hypothetical protein